MKKVYKVLAILIFLIMVSYTLGACIIMIVATVHPAAAAAFIASVAGCAMVATTAAFLGTVVEVWFKQE